MNDARKPGEAPYTTRTPRVSAALKLHRRKERDETGLFLAEGPQAVGEAIAAGVVRELFVTEAALLADLGVVVGDSRDLRVSSPPQLQDRRVSVVDDQAMAALSDTVNPQGMVAVCEQLDVPLEEAVARKPRLVAVAVDIRDPGNAGTILRTADAAGANVVIFAGDAVDPYNGKCVRASAGSIFHVDIVRERDIDKVLSGLTGLQLLATTGRGAVDLFEIEPRLIQPTAWLFGSEAHGLPENVLDRAERVRVPIYGGAESLNLAAAAAVCLYASARAQHSPHEL